MEGHRRRAVLVVTIQLAMIVACGEDSPTAPPLPRVATFTLSGVVATADSSEPLAGATVQVVDGPHAGRSTTTAADGTYSLSGLGGSVTVQASSDGFVTEGKTITVEADTRLDFGLERSLDPSEAAIRGTVTDVLRGGGVAGVAVEVPGKASTRTDATGAYALDVDGSGTVGLALKKASHWTRESHVLLGSDRPADLTVIPRNGDFDMSFFDHLFRWKGTQGTRRWLEQPAFEIWTRRFECLEAFGESCDRMRATEATVGVFETTVRAVLSRDVGELTGGFLSGGPIRTRTHEAGTVLGRGEMNRPGVVTIVLVETGFTDLSWARWQTVGDGELISGHVQMNFRHVLTGCLYSHELAHVFGYHHPDGQWEVPRASVMGCSGVTPDDRLHARVLYRRPPGSRSPDTDPQSFVVSAAARAGRPVRGPVVTEEAH